MNEKLGASCLKVIKFCKEKALPFFSSRLSAKSDLHREETDIKKMLLDYHANECKFPELPGTKTPPQAIQGMWQAYGYMRAARTRGRFALFATGIIGTGLMLYRFQLSSQEKEIAELQKSNDTRSEELDMVEQKLFEESNRWRNINTEFTAKLIASYRTEQESLNNAEMIIRGLCKNSENSNECYNNYTKTKDSIKIKFNENLQNSRNELEKQYNLKHNIDTEEQINALKK